jgi:putative ABC transport system ATP-binding protein
VPAWTVPAGGRVLVRGPSGSGKTTLLAVLSGLIRPRVGVVRVLGQDLAQLRGAALDRWRGRSLGIVLQTLHLVRPLDVLGNLRLAAFLAGVPVETRRLAALLDRVRLADRARARPFELSQGEAQRVAIARAMVARPRLVLADEPTSALDDRNCAVVADLLDEAAGASGATLVVATHDARLAARWPTTLELGSFA